MHAHERTVDGDLALTGDALKIFQVPVDSLTARIGLESGRAHVDQLELKRGEDFLRAQGKIDLAQKKSFTLSAESWCRELVITPSNSSSSERCAGALSAKLTGAGDEKVSAARFPDKPINSLFLRKATGAAMPSPSIHSR